MMKWNNKVQKLGRIQVPTDYLKSYNIKEGTNVEIKQTKDNLILNIKFKKRGRK